MGSQQTKFFAELLCSELPKALINEIKDNDYTICDVGCALGEAVSTYSKFFKRQLMELTLAKKQLIKQKH